MRAIIGRQQGFSLIELIVGMAILAILTRLAYGTYTQHVIKSNRRAAQAQMMDIANREQQYLIANRTYADATTLAGSGYNLPTEVSSKYGYTITVGNSTVPSYTITFTPTGTQASDGALTLNSAGAKAPASQW